MDLTIELSSLLVQKHSPSKIPTHTAYRTDRLDSFLKEAYHINQSITSLLRYLRAVRQPYLSTTSEPRQKRRSTRLNHAHQTESDEPFSDIPQYLTDAQRESIDSQTSSLLRDINSNITNLATATALRNETAEKLLEKKHGKPVGRLWSWAAGDGDTPDAGKSPAHLAEEGEVKTTKLFRDGVLWYLNYSLSNTVHVQQEMVQIRLDRAQEKRKSTLYDTRNKGVRLSRDDFQSSPGGDTGPGGPGGGSQRYGNIDLRAHDTYNPSLSSSDPSATQQELTAEQMQLFESENTSILNHYNSQLAQISQAEKSLMEISSLQQTLVGHLNVQGDMIGQLVEDAANTDENVKRGNKELKKASERGSTAKLVCYATTGLCAFLVAWDLVF